MMGVGKSKAKAYVQKETGITFKDVAGQDEAKESLQEVVDFLHNPSKYTAIGAKLPKGALLVGPPGTGKTSVALKCMVEEHLQAEHDILLLAYTNRAVDEICAMLSAIESHPQYIRIGREFSCAPHYQDNLLENMLGKLSNRQEVIEKVKDTQPAFPSEPPCFLIAVLT